MTGKKGEGEERMGWIWEERLVALRVGMIGRREWFVAPIFPLFETTSSYQTSSHSSRVSRSGVYFCGRQSGFGA